MDAEFALVLQQFGICQKNYIAIFPAAVYTNSSQLFSGCRVRRVLLVRALFAEMKRRRLRRLLHRGLIDLFVTVIVVSPNSLVDFSSIPGQYLSSKT